MTWEEDLTLSGRSRSSQLIDLILRDLEQQTSPHQAQRVSCSKELKSYSMSVESPKVCDNIGHSRRKWIKISSPHHTPTYPNTHPTHPTDTVLSTRPIPLFLSREVNGLLLLFISIKSRATGHWEDVWIGGRQRVLGVLGVVGVPRVGRVWRMWRKLSALGLWRGWHNASTRTA